MAANLPNMARNVNLQIHKATCMSNMVNPLNSMPRNFTTSLLKAKHQENTLKGARKKHNKKPTFFSLGEKLLERQWISHQKPLGTDGKGAVFFRS